MKAHILKPTGPVNAIYTEDNNIPHQEKSESRKEIGTKRFEMSAWEHRTVMYENYHTRSIGTGLGFGNICIG